MQFFPDGKTVLTIGPFSIRWYAVLILTGAFVAYLLSRRNTRKMKYPDAYLFDLFFDLAWVGIIGARLWFCAFYDLGYYLSNPAKIFAIYEGGLAIHGGIIFGSIYALYYCKKHNISFLRVVDAVVPNVMVAQAIGRWGNFANKEAHGPEVAESFFDGPLFFLKEGMCINGHYYQPTFFYESVLNLIGFFLIVFVLKKHQNKRGDLMWAYLMWYGMIRFFIESLRTDALMIGPLRIAQLVSITYIVLGMCGYLGLFERFFKKEKPAVLFDLDGTLIDSEKGLVESVRRIYEKYGDVNDFTIEKQKELLGPPVYKFFEKNFPNLDRDVLVKEFRENNFKLMAEYNKLMPNAKEVLQTLHDEGYHLGIVSTKPTATVKKCLELAEIEKYFDDVIGGDEVESQKPHPEGIEAIMNRNHWLRDEAIYIGDSPTDIEAGKAFGAYTIGYYFDETRKEQLNQAQANRYISDLDEVLTIVKEKHHFTYNEK